MNQALLRLFREAADEEELDALFDLFLTPDEVDAVGKRYEIVKGLLLGENSQREMAQDLGLSIAKITRGSNALKRSSLKLKEKIRRCLDN